MVSYSLEGFHILVLDKEIKQEVQKEEACDHIIDYSLHLVAWHSKSDIKDSCEARISDQSEHPHIENSFPL